MHRADRIEVRLLSFDCKVATAIWISRSAEIALTEFSTSNDGALFAKKLKEVAQRGFINFEGGVVRNEGHGVYRIGIKKSLFRLLGFYGESGFKTEFIVIVAVFKSGQKRGSRNDKRVMEVAAIKKHGTVVKVQT